MDQSDLAKHHVLSIQPLGLGSANEELGAVGVGSSIGHGENSWSRVLQTEILVLKLAAVNRLSSSSISSCKPSSLTRVVHTKSEIRSVGSNMFWMLRDSGDVEVSESWVLGENPAL